MGLNDFVDEGEDEQNSEDEPENTDGITTTAEDQKQSTKNFIAAKIRQRVENSELDITVEDGRIEGDQGDVALLFAHMTMDFGNAEFDKLIND